MILTWICLTSLVIIIGLLTLRKPQCSCLEMTKQPFSEHKNIPWIKAKLRVNNSVMAGFYRMIPGVGMRYYSINKKLIDEKENRISVLEGLDSSPIN